MTRDSSSGLLELQEPNQIFLSFSVIHKHWDPVLVGISSLTISQPQCSVPWTVLEERKKEILLEFGIISWHLVIGKKYTPEDKEFITFFYFQNKNILFFPKKLIWALVSIKSYAYMRLLRIRYLAVDINTSRNNKTDRQLRDPREIIQPFKPQSIKWC